MAEHKEGLILAKINNLKYVIIYISEIFYRQKENNFRAKQEA